MGPDGSFYSLNGHRLSPFIINQPLKGFSWILQKVRREFLRRRGPNGMIELGIMCGGFQTNHRDWHDFVYLSLFFQFQPLWSSIHLLALSAGTQLRPSETGGLIFLSLWQLQRHREISLRSISATQQPYCPTSSVSWSIRGAFARTDFKRPGWMTREDTKTERWRDAGQSVSVSGCQAASISCKQWSSPCWPLTARRGTWISNQMWKTAGPHFSWEWNTQLFWRL